MLFNCEGYQLFSIEWIVEYVGIFKMIFYCYYVDKEVFILVIFKQKESEFMQDLVQIIVDKVSVWEKLFVVFDYYYCWFICEMFYGCMFICVLFEYGVLLLVIWE